MPEPPRRGGPARKYDAGDRREKQEEMRRLAEMKRQREQAAAGPVGRAPEPAPEVQPGPKDARFEGRHAKREELRLLHERRAKELLAARKDPRQGSFSRWKEQSEARGQTMESRLADLFGAGPAKKPSREQAKRRK